MSTGYFRDPDVQLMLKVRDGDEGAFAQLVAAYQDRLVGILAHLVADQTTAEDLAQEVFLRVYRARSEYEPTARFSTWLFCIANNLASNSRRNKGRRREVELEAPAQKTDKTAAPAITPIEKSALMPTRRIAREELQAQVQEAIAALNERQRMAVLLHKYEEMSYVDIADAMNLTVPAVKSLLSRARECLRRHLAAYVREDFVLPPAGPEATLMQSVAKE
jgi:RNA polymerase sigma-70 factor, ECF subfamily